MCLRLERLGAHHDVTGFGIIHRVAADGAAVHILCCTHGEASALNQTGGNLRATREAELRQASDELGAASVTLLDYPDSTLAAFGADLPGHVRELITGHRGLCVRCSAAPRSGTPARPRPPRYCGGGSSFSASASTCAG